MNGQLNMSGTSFNLNSIPTPNATATEAQHFTMPQGSQNMGFVPVPNATTVGAQYPTMPASNPNMGFVPTPNSINPGAQQLMMPQRSHIMPAGAFTMPSMAMPNAMVFGAHPMVMSQSAFPMSNSSHFMQQSSAFMPQGSYPMSYGSSFISQGASPMTAGNFAMAPVGQSSYIDLTHDDDEVAQAPTAGAKRKRAPRKAKDPAQPPAKKRAPRKKKQTSLQDLQTQGQLGQPQAMASVQPKGSDGVLLQAMNMAQPGGQQMPQQTMDLGQVQSQKAAPEVPAAPATAPVPAPAPAEPQPPKKTDAQLLVDHPLYGNFKAELVIDGVFMADLDPSLVQKYLERASANRALREETKAARRADREKRKAALEAEERNFIESLRVKDGDDFWELIEGPPFGRKRQGVSAGESDNFDSLQTAKYRPLDYGTGQTLYINSSDHAFDDVHLAHQAFLRQQQQREERERQEHERQRERQQRLEREKQQQQKALARQELERGHRECHPEQWERLDALQCELQQVERDQFQHEQRGPARDRVELWQRVRERGQREFLREQLRAEIRTEQRYLVSRLKAAAKPEPPAPPPPSPAWKMGASVSISLKAAVQAIRQQSSA